MGEGHVSSFLPVSPAEALHGNLMLLSHWLVSDAVPDKHTVGGRGICGGSQRGLWGSPTTTPSDWLHL